MNKLLSHYYTLAAMMGIMADEHINNMFAEDYHYTPASKEPTKTWKEQMESKGLQEFEINGITIIAHNEREAMKRYKHRNK